MNTQIGFRPTVETASWQELTQEKISNSNFLFLDLRSEKEFRKGHMTGAMNLPLLNDAERHAVGLLYKKEGKNKALVLGFQFFQKKSKAFLEEVKQKASHLQSNGKLVLYCARGGMRSQLTAGFLTSLGYQVLLAEGGYKSYRNLVLEDLEKKLPNHEFLVLHGHTGSGKTELLKELAKPQYKIGILDFENLAHHSGSIFGDLNQNEEKATQSQFENNLFSAYKKVQHFKCLVVEIESTLGEAKLSPSLHHAITSSPMLHITRSHEKRLISLEKDYTKNWDQAKKDLVIERLSILKQKFSKENFEKLKTFLEEKNFKQFLEIVLKEHYDPQYAKSLKKYDTQILASFSMSSGKKELLNFIKSYVSHKNSATLPPSIGTQFTYPTAFSKKSGSMSA